MTSNTVNLYWPVYLNLEQEVIAISYQIHFDDNQLQVYSLKIAELLIRVSVEIESLAKELYFLNGGTVPVDSPKTKKQCLFFKNPMLRQRYRCKRSTAFAIGKRTIICPFLRQEKNQPRDLYFDTDCLDFLEEKWVLSKKAVLVTAANSYFQKEENRILTPLNKANKRGTSGADWKQAYQAVKHNRSKDLRKGNLKHLIRAMAALYVLNLYYRDEKVAVDQTFPSSVGLGSGLFSVKTMYVSFDSLSGEEDTSDHWVSCVCIRKFSDSAYRNAVLAGREDFAKRKEALLHSHELATFMQSNPSYSFEDKHIIQICKEIGGDEFMRRIMQTSNKSSSIYLKSQNELILNKNMKVYPGVD